jgi:hypothetical protein
VVDGPWNLHLEIIAAGIYLGQIPLR